MTIADKIKLLKSHKINHVTNRQNTQLLVESVWVDSKSHKEGSDWIEATEWDKRQLLDWMGY